MNTTMDSAQQKIEAYLRELRGRLRGISDEDAREIVAELRSHIIDKASAPDGMTAASVEAALAALGTPEELAGQYVADDVLVRTERSHSPLRILGGLFRWAGMSIAGVFVLLGAIVGYTLGISFFLCALLKPFHPHTAGLWLLRAEGESFDLSLRLGFSSAPAGGRELLGWWIVPLGFLLGFLLMLLTSLIARWCVRAYRRSRTPRGFAESRQVSARRG